MKRFHFSLAAVLTVRQSAENTALKAYAEALLNKQNAFARVDALHRELGLNWTQIRTALATQCKAEQIEQLRKYGASLEEELARAEAILSEAERDLSAALQKMLSARQQRQAIETFRETQRAQHERELIRDEQKFLDDLASRPGVPAMAWKVVETALT